MYSNPTRSMDRGKSQKNYRTQKAEKIFLYFHRKTIFYSCQKRLLTELLKLYFIRNRNRIDFLPDVLVFGVRSAEFHSIHKQEPFAQQ